MPSTIVLCSLLLALRLIGCTQWTLESPAIHWATSAGICCLSSQVKDLTQWQLCFWPWKIFTRGTMWKPDCSTSLRRWSGHQPRQALSSRPGLVRPGHWYPGLGKLRRLCLISWILLSRQFFFAIKYLHQAYQCLSKKNFQHQHFHDVCFKFLLQYQALEFLAPEYTWYIKPKFHGMAELALAFDNPSMNWVYRDEEAGGTLARLGRSKGNLQTPWSVSINVLQRFAAECRVFYACFLKKELLPCTWKAKT